MNYTKLVKDCISYEFNIYNRINYTLIVQI